MPFTVLQYLVDKLSLVYFGEDHDILYSFDDEFMQRIE